MATINAAECYGLKGIGAVSPGYNADLIIIDNLQDFNILKVFKDGKLVAKNCKPLFNEISHDYSKVSNTINIKEIKKADFDYKIDSDIVNVIRVLPHSLVTEKVVRKVDMEDGVFKYNNKLDILKLAVIERHRATGNIGLALVEGFELKGGAIAQTIAHDSHNIIVIGDNDEDMMKAVNNVAEIGGGITICSGGKIVKSLPLPIAGVMSNKPMEEIDEKLEDMIKIAYEELNVNRGMDPFMTLSFLALPVIPEIKLTDMGLFNVNYFSFMDRCVEE
jgi:adenine deaminase